MPSIVLTTDPFAKRDVRHGLDDFLYKVVPGTGTGRSNSTRVSTDHYKLDNCPYVANPSKPMPMATASATPATTA